jgi:hypothetical protein
MISGSVMVLQRQPSVPGATLPVLLVNRQGGSASSVVKRRLPAKPTDPGSMAVSARGASQRPGRHVRRATLVDPSKAGSI